MTEEKSPTRPDDHADSEPESQARGAITLYEQDGHHIWAEIKEDGGLNIAGQDLHRPGIEEYEYAFSIPPGEFPRIVEALNGNPGDPILDLLASNADRIMPGVKGWLDIAGADYEFWSRVE